MRAPDGACGGNRKELSNIPYPAYQDADVLHGHEATPVCTLQMAPGAGGETRLGHFQQLRSLYLGAYRTRSCSSVTMPLYVTPMCTLHRWRLQRGRMPLSSF